MQQQQLYAAGFNAWNQLRLERAPTTVHERLSAGGDTEPHDITTFECVLEAADIGPVWPSHTSTAVATSHGILTAGAVSVDAELEEPVDRSRRAEALNGHVIVCEDGGTICHYEQHAQQDTAVAYCTRFAGFPEVEMAVAYDVGFAVLTASGQVWTWGDGRFPECLGREVTEESPSDRPGRVTALDDLPTGPIVKIAAGGFLLAALTQGRDLYCWGGHHPGRQQRLPALEGLTGEPAPVIVDLGEADDMVDTDLADVGVGDAHMIVLTADGAVCVTGSNANGQLGLGLDDTEADDSDGGSPWVRVTKGLPAEDSEQRVTAVYAGPRSSFIVVTTS